MIHFVINSSFLIFLQRTCLEKMGNSGTAFPGNFCICREIVVNKIKKYISEIVGNYDILEGGKFYHLEKKFWSHGRKF